MEKVMSASRTGMTDGQIENVCAKLRDALRKHREEISSEAAQTAIEAKNIGMMMFTPFREQAEALSEIIVRRVKVDRSRDPQAAISATKRAEYTNSEVVSRMPQCEGEEVDVYFFPLKRTTNVSDFQKALDNHGLKPDPYAIMAVNEADPAFADTHPNATQWVDEEGHHCSVAFYRWGDEREVTCFRYERAWRDGWWVGGVRKS